MAANTGTIIPNDAPLKLADTSDDGYVAEANDLQGGHFQAATLAERDAIRPKRLKEGMLCTVVETGRTYRRGGGFWTDIRAETDAGITTLTGRADSVDDRIEGLELGDTYTVALFTQLPSLTNSGAKAIYASVFGDAADKNGRYVMAPASSVWSKVAGDQSGRIATLETNTSPLYLSTAPLAMADGRVLLLSLCDSAGRVAAGLLSTGEWMSVHGHPAASVSQDGFMSAADKAWKESLPFTVPAEPVSASDGRSYVLTINDPGGRIAAGLATTGEWVSVHGHGDATTAASGFMTPDAVSKLSQQPFTVATNFFSGELNYLIAIVDAAGRIAWGITSDGAVRSAKNIVTELVTNPVFPTLTAQNLTSSEIHLADSAISIRTDRPGWLLTMEDSANRVGFGIKSDGTITAPGLFIPGLSPGTITTGMLADSSITSPKLDLTLRRKTGTDLIPTRPDDLRPQLSAIGVRSTQSWRSLPDHLTPCVWGTNTTGLTVEFRNASGLLIRGERYKTTFDPGSVGSVTFRGQIVAATPWPPTLTPAPSVGDYLTCVVANPLSIAGNTVNSGDNMVWNGSAWVYQASPGSGSPRYERDWWRAGAAGTFSGVALNSGDVLIFLGTASTPSDGVGLGAGKSSWRRGRPDRGEFFRRGSFDPAGGLPSSPVNGDFWEVSASGAAGGFSFAANDALARDGGVWIQVDAQPIKSVAAGAGFHLPCVVSSREKEFRVPSNPITQVSLSMKGRGLRLKWLSLADILLRGDSMTAAIGRMLILQMAPRAVTYQSYGGCTGRGILGQAESLIDLGDPDAGKVVVSVQGQNNIGDLGQIQECAEAFAQITGTAGGRIVHVTVLGSRVFTWNGTRLVCDGFESQMPAILESSNNAYAAAKRYFRDSWPDQYIDFWAALREAAMTDNEVALDFPGKTIAQVATDYGILPLKYMDAVDWTGIDPALGVYKGTWSTAGRPTGGNANDYYIRTGNGQIGSLEFNVAGTWRAVTFDFLHVTDAASAFVAAKIKAFLDAKNW